MTGPASSPGPTAAGSSLILGLGPTGLSSHSTCLAQSYINGWLFRKVNPAVRLLCCVTVRLKEAIAPAVAMSSVELSVSTSILRMPRAHFVLHDPPDRRQCAGIQQWCQALALQHLLRSQTCPNGSASPQLPFGLLPAWRRSYRVAWLGWTTMTRFRC